MTAPSKAMELKAAITAIFAAMTAFWGWTGWLVIVWLSAMILDYATGSWAALSTGSWDSAVARAGLWHKLGSIVAMLVALLLDVALSAIINYGDLGFDLPFEYKSAFLPLVAIWVHRDGAREHHGECGKARRAGAEVFDQLPEKAQGQDGRR